jgi:hypothetical protein
MHKHHPSRRSGSERAEIAVRLFRVEGHSSPPALSIMLHPCAIALHHSIAALN